jgi:hypothetical protein
MDILATRTRIAGTPPHYGYRALVPVTALSDERRRWITPVVAPDHCRRQTCARLAEVIAPAGYFTLPPRERVDLAPRIARLARRIEALITRILYPEMTADRIPIVFRVDHDPGDAAMLVTIDDITGAFETLESEAVWLTAFDLGLRQDRERHAA